MGDQPSRVPLDLIKELLALADSNGLIASAGSITIGDEVQINAGPFAGMTGLLHNVSGPARVQVLLDLLGQQRVVGLGRSMVMPASRASNSG